MSNGPRVAPCTWQVSYSPALQGSASLEPYFSMPATGMASYEEMATAYLWRWTGRSLGPCEVTVRPCRSDAHPGISTFNGYGPFSQGGWGGLWRPVIIDGLWYNIGWCDACGVDSCGCEVSSSAGPRTIKLPGPVAAIISVVEDGVTVPASGYRVDNSELLVREDGGHWPRCQQMDLTNGQVGTFSITYMRGAAVPAGGDVVAGLLATELWKAANGDPSCGLPKRIQTVTRQGVTVAMIDNFSDVQKGGTGIWMIDAWVSSLNQPLMRSRVLSPDLKKPRVTTSSSGGTGFSGSGFGY